MVYDTALIAATYGPYRDFLLTDPERKDRLAESAVEAFSPARSKVKHFEVRWWREGVREAGFVLVKGDAMKLF